MGSGEGMTVVMWGTMSVGEQICRQIVIHEIFVAQVKRRERTFSEM